MGSQLPCRRSASVSLCARTAERPLRNGCQSRAQSQVARPGTVGDAGIDDGDGNVAAEAAAEQVGPELSLGEDEELGLEGVQVGRYGPGQVERAIEDAVGAEALAGKSPGRCGWWWR